MTEKVSFSCSISLLANVAAIVGRFSLFSPPLPGMCLRRRRDSLGDGQVHFVTQSKTGGSSQAEETSPGDGKEDGH